MIRKKKLQILYNDFRTKKQRNYYKYYSFRGTFPDILDKEMDYNILDMFNVDKYEKEKDKAINDIGKKEKKKVDKRIKELQYKIGHIKLKNITQSELCKSLGLSTDTICRWKRIEKKEFEEETKESEEDSEPLEETEEFLES